MDSIKVPTPTQIMNILAEFILDSDATEFGHGICHGPGPQVTLEFINDSDEVIAEYKISVERTK
jgi:hypothetical protein